jgi:hypothetical protein
MNQNNPYGFLQGMQQPTNVGTGMFNGGYQGKTPFDSNVITGAMEPISNPQRIATDFQPITMGGVLQNTTISPQQAMNRYGGSTFMPLTPEATPPMTNLPQGIGYQGSTASNPASTIQTDAFLDRAEPVPFQQEGGGILDGIKGMFDKGGMLEDVGAKDVAQGAMAVGEFLMNNKLWKEQLSQGNRQVALAENKFADYQKRNDNRNTNIRNHQNADKTV